MSGAPGLAYYHQSSPDLEGFERDFEPIREGCPNRAGMLMVDLLSGRTAQARCGRNGCAYCLSANARRRALAVSYSRPEREIRLSLVADDSDLEPFRTARYRINKTREYLKRWGEEPGAWGWNVERNPKCTGYHAHVVQHGPSKIDKDALDSASVAAGAGLARVRKVREVGSLAAYGLKGAALAAYGFKGVVEGSEYLMLNGGRLGHYSRGFFRAPDGGTLPVRAAERLAMRARYGEREHGQWTVMTEASARSWASLGAVDVTHLALVTLAPGTSPAG